MLTLLLHRVFAEQKLVEIDNVASAAAAAAPGSADVPLGGTADLPDGLTTGSPQPPHTPASQRKAAIAAEMMAQTAGSQQQVAFAEKVIMSNVSCLLLDLSFALQLLVAALHELTAFSDDGDHLVLEAFEKGFTGWAVFCKTNFPGALMALREAEDKVRQDLQVPPGVLPSPSPPDSTVFQTYLGKDANKVCSINVNVIGVTALVRCTGQCIDGRDSWRS